MAQQQVQNYQFTIDGMTCAGCAARIEKTLAGDAKTTHATVNFAAKTATVVSSRSADEIKAMVAAIGYAASETFDIDALERKENTQLKRAQRELLFAALLAIPVVVLGMFAPEINGSGVIQMILTAIILIVPGRGFFLRAAKLLRHGDLSMDSLVSLGTAATFIFSVYLLSVGHQHLYFESAAVIIGFILTGKYLEERARQAISQALRQLLKLQPSEATLLVGNYAAEEKEQRVPIANITPGSLLLVRPGDRFPVDGVVRRGGSSVDVSMLTGENQPIEVDVGAKVAAGTQNLTGPLVIETTGVGAATELSRIIAMVEAAQGTKAPIQKLADKVAAWFVPFAVVVAFMTFLTWWFLDQNLTSSLTAAVAVLVVACPCALGLATPVALMAGTGVAARRGILVRDAAALEVLHKVTTIIFDKTGTLTTGRPEVKELRVLSSAGVSREVVLNWARSLEHGSHHPSAQAIVRYAEHFLSPELSPISLQNIRETAGVGVAAEAKADGLTQQIRIGRLNSFYDLNNLDQALLFASDGHFSDASYVGLVRDQEIVAVFALADQLRPEATESIEGLIKMGIKPIMATGDSEGAASVVAKALGGLEFRWSQSPADKASLVQQLRARGEVVAMAGDGINDAPALAAADVGIAMASGTDAARASAGVTLKDSSIQKLVEAVQISRLTFRNIKENLFWAFAYNILLVPAAALGQLSPMLAGAAMALSSLFVVGNALRLKLRL